jgi:hypothetical protein
VALDLLLFIPLAVLTNTAFPLPFDYVLLWFAAGRAFPEACVFAALGSGARRRRLLWRGTSRGAAADPLL